MTIAPFSPNHSAGVVSLILAVQQSEFQIPITLEDQPDLLVIPAFYQKGKGNFWVAVDRDEVVGTLGLLDIGDDRAALRKMFVRATHRGAQCGVGKGLLDTLIGWCATQGLREVYLGTTEKFLAAHRFYEKNAFREISRAELPASFPAMKVDNKFYCRAL